MFGYVRPNKGELLVREFVRFRSVYCGICKVIGKTYGQFPRIALTYDITMLGVLLVSLADIDSKEKMDRCILNPVTRKPMLIQNEILDRCAALCIIFAYEKFMDEIQDEKPFRGRIGRMMLKNAYLKAAGAYPEEAALIKNGLIELRKIEESDIHDNLQYERAASAFGEILQSIFNKSFSAYFKDEIRGEILLKGITRLGFHLGKWIFTIDAVDDYESDIKNGNWNPFMNESQERSKEIALDLMTECETQIDQIAALLPYKRDAGIISNIFQNGLPAIRQKIFLNQKLGRL